MKKILVAFDGLKFSGSTRDYGIAVAKQNEACLVGVFLEDQAYHSYSLYDLITKEGGGLHTKKRHLEKKDEKTRAAAVLNFEKACMSAGLNFIVHKDRFNAIDDLLKESLYTDLLLIDYSESMVNHPQKLPTRFIHELLPGVQCPVMLVPPRYRPIDKLILLFDGSPSSVFAIKMLCYTLPAYGQYPVEIVTVNSTNELQHWPDNRLLKEFMNRHLPQVRYTALKGFPETEVVELLKYEKNVPLVVLGAYNRGKVSRWIRESMADVLMRELELPLFIAHAGR